MRGLVKSRSGQKAVKMRGSDTKLEDAYRQLRRTGTLTRAAKAARVSPERLRRFLRENALAERSGRSWRIIDSDLRRMTMFTSGRAENFLLRGFEPASLVGQHLAAVKAFLETNDPEHLARFVGRSITDANGKVHIFETDPNTLYRLATEREGYPEIYRFVQ